MINLYTIETCPKCKILKAKLNSKNIPYTEITDNLVHKEKGFEWFPILEVDGKLYEFSEANAYINSLSEE